MQTEKYPETICVYLPRGVKSQIEALADARGMSTSTFLRVEVLTLLRRRQNQRTATASRRERSTEHAVA